MGSVDNVNGAMEPAASTNSDKVTDTKRGPPDGAPMKERWGPVREIVLDRVEGSPLGISIVGGRIDPFKNSNDIISGIFIKNVIANTPAGRNGSLEIGDRILEVNGNDLREASYEDAVKAIRGSQTPVKFMVQSLLKQQQQPKVDIPKVTVKQDSQSRQDSQSKIVAKDLVKDVVIIDKIVKQESKESSKAENDAKQKEVNAKERKEEDDDDDDDEDEDEDEDDEEEESPVKTKRPKYHDVVGTIHTIELDCDADEVGLSLAGNRDLGTMSVFVAGVRPNSTVGRDGRIKVGDELLEVNGHLLYGRSHLNATAIIKAEAEGMMTLMFVRSDDGLSRMAVKPLTTLHNRRMSQDPPRRLSQADGTSRSPSRPSTPVPDHDHPDGAPNDLKLPDKQENHVRDLPSPVTPAIQKEGNRRLSAAPLDPGRRRSSANSAASHEHRAEEPRIIEPESFKEFSVDMVKKSGRGLGISVRGNKDKGGIYIAELVKGGLVEVDGRLMPGDELVTVNSEDLHNVDPTDAITILKSLVGKITFNIRRVTPAKSAINGEHLRKSASTAENANFRDGHEGITASESY